MLQELFLTLGCAFFVIKIFECFARLNDKPKSMASEFLGLMALAMPLMSIKGFGEVKKEEEKK